MSHEVDIHKAQIAILRELLFTPEAGFSDLRKPTDLDSAHFKFHIARLVELGFVQKKNPGRYQLTHKGKEHANKLDTDAHTIERQPKLSVLVVGWRQRKNSHMEFLVQQRLKNPYYGFWCRIGGKVRWGETAAEAAARELKEEAGLEADLTFQRFYHKLDYNQQTDEMLEDKFFIVFLATNFRGRLIKEFEAGRNAWLTQDELNAQEKLFAGLEDSEATAKDMTPFIEKKYFYDPDDY